MNWKGKKVVFEESFGTIVAKVVDMSDKEYYVIAIKDDWIECTLDEFLNMQEEDELIYKTEINENYYKLAWIRKEELILYTGEKLSPEEAFWNKVLMEAQ
jgi:hypothetical protein